MKNRYRILVIEDDKYIMSFISTSLKNEGYLTISASTGTEAKSLFQSNNPDIVLLDLGLPDMEGSEIIQYIRNSHETPIIIVSAREEESEKINALDYGADDYIVKPFSVGELLARIRVAQRRISSIENQINMEVFRYLGLCVDNTKGLVYLDNTEVHLTPLEFKLLSVLIANRGKVLTHNFILKQVWGYSDSTDAQNLRVIMASLRRKIERDPSNPKFILTQVGVGYRFSEK